MDSSALQLQIKGFLVVAACLLLAVFLGYVVGNEDYESLLFGFVIVVGFIFWLFSGRFFWVFTIASSFLAGTFPILRGQFTPFQILMAMGLAKFLVEDVILRRTPLKTPERFDVLMIAGFMSVITYHAVSDRFGMRFLGSTVWGGRHYVNVFVGLAAYFVIQNIPIETKLWRKFPYVVLAIFGFDLFIGIVTTLAPSSIYIIYPFYSAVSNASLQEAIGGPSDLTGRIGAFGNFGFSLIAIVLSTVSLRSILHPSNFFRLSAALVGAIGVLLSGFRSAVLNTFLLVCMAGIRDLKARAFILLPLVAVGLFSLSVVNSEVVELPRQIQRALVFLPGNWDPMMARDAAASNDFRMQLWTLWANEYFPRQPILGRGFGFESEWTKTSVFYGAEATDFHQMVETGNLHNGFLAALDTFGILGTIFFVAWSIVLLIRALRVSLKSSSRDDLPLRFLALYLAVAVVSYSIGSSSVGTFLPQQFALAGLFMALRRHLKASEGTKGRAARPPSDYATIERSRGFPRPTQRSRAPVA